MHPHAATIAQLRALSLRPWDDLMAGGMPRLSLKERMRRAKRNAKANLAEPPRQYDTGLWEFLRQVVSCDVSGCTAKGADWTQCACRDKRAADWFANREVHGVSFYDNKPRDGGNIR